jgi:hypothetical protein
LNQWRREAVKAGGGYFENGRKCEISWKWEKMKIFENGRMWKNVSNYR